LFRVTPLAVNTLSHVASNQSVELRDIVTPIVSSDASVLANTVSSLLSLHSCPKNAALLLPPSAVLNLDCLLMGSHCIHWLFT
jgi:hypothetical protein